MQNTIKPVRQGNCGENKAIVADIERTHLEGSVRRAARIPIRHRWYIRRIKLNRGGYDSAGSYWGIGNPLWYVYRADGAFDFHIRGHRDFAACAYRWVENYSDPAAACRHLNAIGKIGTPR